MSVKDETVDEMIAFARRVRAALLEDGQVDQAERVAIVISHTGRVVLTFHDVRAMHVGDLRTRLGKAVSIDPLFVASGLPGSGSLGERDE